MSKMETHRYTDRHTDGQTSGGKQKQLKCLKGATNQPPLINLNMKSLTRQWQNRCYIVVSSNQF